MPLPLFLLPLLTKAKGLLSPKVIITVLAVALGGYLVWSYNSLRSENGALKAEIATAHAEIEQGNAQIVQCYSQVEDLNENILDLQKEHDETLNNALSKFQAICVRKDTVSRLNDSLKEAGVVADEKPSAVLEVQRSLNERLNNRGVTQ